METGFDVALKNILYCDFAALRVLLPHPAPGPPLDKLHV